MFSTPWAGGAVPRNLGARVTEPCVAHKGVVENYIRWGLSCTVVMVRKTTLPLVAIGTLPES